MKMDKPSPVASAVHEVQSFSPPTASTNEDQSSIGNSVCETNDRATSSTNDGTDSKPDSNGKTVTDDDDNLLNYIAELAGENLSDSAEMIPEEELLGVRSATTKSSIVREKDAKGTNDSPVSSSTPTVGELDPNGASTSCLSSISSPSHGSCQVSDLASSIDSTPRQNSSAAVNESSVPILSNQSTNGDKDGETMLHDIEEEDGESSSNGTDKESDVDEIDMLEPDDPVSVQDDVSSSNNRMAPPVADTSDGNDDSKMSDDEPEVLTQDQSAEITCIADSTTSEKTDSETVDAGRDVLLDKFIAFCRRSGSVSQSSLAVSIREKFVLTDLLKWFLEEEGRPALPLTFQKRLRQLGFTVPTSISLPPSQVVDLIVETAPEQSLKDLCGKGSQAGKNDDGSDSVAQRHLFSRYPAPNMTRFLFDIGYNLVSESAYRSALNKAVSELSSSSADADAVQRQSQFVDQIRHAYEDTKKQNQPLKLKTYQCPIDYCSFTTETQLQLYEHQRKPHKKTHRWECALCMKFSSWNDEDMDEHYNYEHGFTSSAKWDAPSSRAPCPLCDQDFPFKGQLKNHLRSYHYNDNVRNVRIATGTLEEMDVLNLQLWPKAEDRRATASQQQKVVSLRIKEGGPPNARVADVVSLVAAGAGHLRSPQKTFGTSTVGSSNLPRLYPSTTVLRSTQSIPQQRLVNQQQQQQLVRQIILNQQQQLQKPRIPSILSQSSQAARSGHQLPTIQRVPPKTGTDRCECEICDAPYLKKLDYLKHLQGDHRKLLDKSEFDLMGAAPLACSRCRDRFYSYEGLERHLLMEHNLVTNELLSKAQKRQDSGKCRICTRIYAFNLLQHLVQDHQRTLCSAEIVYSCDVCHFQCNSYLQLELHLRTHHVETSVGHRNTMATSAPAQAMTYAQPSNTMSVITQRQQPQSTLLLPRLGQQQSSLSSQPQTAAAVLNAAMANHKRPFSGLTTMRPADQINRPPKLIKMGESGLRGTAAAPIVIGNSKAQPSRGPNPPALSSAPSQQQLTANQRKQLRYCCTPCDLKFISYEAVLKHWVERHLKPLRVPLCRIDKCEPCQEKLTKKRRESENGTESGDEEEEPMEGPSKKPRMEDGLVLDLELPELVEREVVAVEDDVEILPPPEEIICLD